MLGSLYDSIFGKTDQGIFDILYSRHGASPPVKREDIRLGGLHGYGEEAAEEEDEEEEEAPATAPDIAPDTSTAPSFDPVSRASAPGSSSKSLFAQDIGGFPLWLVGVGFLGFAWAYRRKRKKQSSRRR